MNRPAWCGTHSFQCARPGVATGDMGIKTTGNDLDNAWIAFDGVRVPEALFLAHLRDDTAFGGQSATESA